MNDVIEVEVAYAEPTVQHIVTVKVAAGSTIAEVIEASGICELFPQIDLNKQKVGVFSQMKQLSDRVEAGDRIEIYRPLLIDPKEARRAKARKQR